jgi:hypothetical protein
VSGEKWIFGRFFRAKKISESAKMSAGSYEVSGVGTGTPLTEGFNVPVGILAALGEFFLSTF